MTSKNNPVDPKLYNRIKARTIRKIHKHSAYRSGIIVTKYKEAFKKKHGSRKSPYTAKKIQQ